MERIVLVLAALGAAIWLFLCLVFLAIGIAVFLRYRKLRRVWAQKYGFWLDLWQKAERKEWGKWLGTLPLLPLLWFFYQRRRYRRPQ